MPDPERPTLGPIIVCGLGHVGYRVVQLLQKLGESVSVITMEARDERIRACQELGAAVLIGDARDEQVLTLAGLAGAKAVIAVTGSDTVNIEIALDAKRLSPNLPVVARLFDQHLALSFEQSFAIRRALATSALAAPSFVAAALDEQIAGAITLGAESFVVVLTKEPGKNAVALAEKDAWLRSSKKAETADAARPPAWLARTLRPWQAVWSDAPQTLRRAGVALLISIAASVVVFKFSLRLSVVDAIYFIVTTVTTVGYGDITPRDSPSAIKLYACCVMLFGSALMAILYSFLTDFVVKERFRALINRKPVPKSGHAIVVGVGNAGYRTLQELARVGVSAVAIDVDQNSQFLADLRVTIPIVIGDARLSGTLSEAGVENAAAVIAMTGNDAVNLGVVLAAKAINPKTRTVVRLFDPEFAEKVQRGSNIDAALSASSIASPTFVGAALYPGVQSAFIVGASLWCLCEWPIEDKWIGRSPADLLTEGMTVVMRRPIQAKKYVTAVATTPLVSGDELLVMVQRAFTAKI